MILSYGLLGAVLAGCGIMGWMVYRVMYKPVQDKNALTDATLAVDRMLIAQQLADELAENRNKAEAFIAIYRDMISKLHQQEITPSRPLNQDHFIHDHVPLQRQIYDRYTENMAVLGSSLYKQIQQLYRTLESETTYVELDPTLELHQIIALIETRIDHAHTQIEQMDQIIPVLRIIQRQKAA